MWRLDDFQGQLMSFVFQNHNRSGGSRSSATRTGNLLSSSFLLSSLELSVTRVHEPYTRALLGTVSQFCEVALSFAIPSVIPHHYTTQSPSAPLPTPLMRANVALQRQSRPDYVICMSESQSFRWVEIVGNADRYPLSICVLL